MISRKLGMTAGLLTLLVACEELPDFDLRDLGDAFDTSPAVSNLPQRPEPDARGVISYPNYQVVVAQEGDTIRTIADRLGLDAEAISTFNGIDADVTLRSDELVALPSRVSGTGTASGTQPLDITAVATTALDRVGPQETTPSAPVTSGSSESEPIRHRVERGETVFTISRLYNVPVRNIAEWNSLGPDLEIREGQFLLIPQGAQRPVPEPVTAPGSGTPTPLPPSAETPLPDPEPAASEIQEAPAAPDLGTPTQAPATQSSARLRFPVEGTIIRDYAPGRNEGIDIGVPAGTPVKAADGGSVAAVTTDTSGVAIVVLKHDDGLLTVYTNLEDLNVAKNDTVSAGQTIGKVREGSPSFLHFEVRRGLNSADPNDFLPS